MDVQQLSGYDEDGGVSSEGAGSDLPSLGSTSVRDDAPRASIEGMNFDNVYRAFGETRGTGDSQHLGRGLADEWIGTRSTQAARGDAS